MINILNLPLKTPLALKRKTIDNIHCDCFLRQQNVNKKAKPMFF